MIIDSNLVLCEGAITASGNSQPVAVSSLSLPGKLTSIPLKLCITQAFIGAESITFTLQQADSATGTFTDIAGSSLSLAAAALTQGTVQAWHSLPPNCTKPWLRLHYTVSGTVTKGSIFCALLREEENGYEQGQYGGQR
jgi:hypothetical protein